MLGRMAHGQSDTDSGEISIWISTKPPLRYHAGGVMKTWECCQEKVDDDQSYRNTCFQGRGRVIPWWDVPELNVYLGLSAVNAS